MILAVSVFVLLGSCFSAYGANYSLPELPYAYDALEPSISGEIMRLHHLKHHQAYINNLNAIEIKMKEAEEKNDIEKIVSLQSALKFNAGGHLNHAFFWTVLTPHGTSKPTGKLAEAINRDFGSFDKMINVLTKAAVNLQGSGWAWLAYNKDQNNLQVATTSNQDSLLTKTSMVPIFGIDVWEHAYYLQYKNVRADYVKSIMNVANWRKVEEYFGKAQL